MPRRPADDAAVVIAQALRDRPDVAAERLADQAAAKFAEAEHALLVSDRRGRRRGRRDAVSPNPVNDHYAAAGFNVTVPVFNGSLYSARHAEAAYRAQVERRGAARSWNPDRPGRDRAPGCR